MKNILEEMYDTFVESLTIKGGSGRTICKIEDKLCKKLKGKEKKLFYDYMNAYSEYADLCAAEGFKHGFKIRCDIAGELSDIS